MKIRSLICFLFFNLLLILFSFPCFASDSFTVNLEMQPMSIRDNRFYIREVIDDRSDQSNIGLVMVGMFNKKVPAYLGSDFKNTIQSYLDVSFSPNPDKIPIIIKITKFEISEWTQYDGEFSRAVAGIGFYKTSEEGIIYKLFETEAFVEKRSFMDVTKYHKENIGNVIEKCFKSFIDSNWETIEAICEVRSSKEKLKIRRIVVEKTASGNLYYHDNKQLTYEQLEAQLIRVPESVPEIIKARGYFGLRQSAFITGVYAIVLPLGEAIADIEEPRWNLALTGLVSLFLGNRCKKLVDKHYEKAVEIYNLKVIL